MEEEYNVKLDLNYQNITKFKEKDAYILIKTITGSRLGIDHLKFSSYGVISFADDDIKQNHPTITTLDKFNRLKVNCIVFDLLYNVQNDGFYDKLFIYSDAAHDEYYNYILYSTETHRQSHKFLLDKEIDILIQSLSREFFTLYNSDIYDFYLAKGKAIDDLRKNHNKSTLYIPSIKDWERMIEKHNNKYQKYTKVV